LTFFSTLQGKSSLVFRAGRCELSAFISDVRRKKKRSEREREK